MPDPTLAADPSPSLPGAASPDSTTCEPGETGPDGRGPGLLPEQADGVEVVAKFFRALGDPTRLRLLQFLLSDEHTVTECVEHVGLSQGRVSTHLACLADCGYVQARREGRRAFYRVTDPRVADLVLAARALAADNVTALACCLRIDAADPDQNARLRPGAV